MQGTGVSKILRLGKYLGTHPADLIRYVRHFRSRPLDIEKPWFSWPSIDFLSSYVTPSMRVFEYGSGGSTIFFARRAGKVVSSEDDPQWSQIVGSHCKQSGVNNAEVRNTRLDCASLQVFASCEYVTSLDDRYDIIVVDGSEKWPIEILRPTCFYHAEMYVAAGGIIVVDDAWRYDGLIRPIQLEPAASSRGSDLGELGLLERTYTFIEARGDDHRTAQGASRSQWWL